MSDLNSRATQPLQPEKSLGDLLGEFTSDFSTLLRQEVELAKVEARQELSRAGKAAGLFAGAGLGAWMALIFLSFALAWLLDQALNTALSFAIVGVIWAVAAALLALRGKKQIAAVKPLQETVTTLKEDVQWVKTQKN
ncbi:MAG: phage holin family protein [Ilumatobacteraceae bacterium]